MNVCYLPTIFLAIIFDLLLGDPPNRFHPVAWMGKLISLAHHHKPPGGPQVALVYGTFITLAGSALVAGIGSIFIKITAHLPLMGLLEAALLKSTYSVRGLDRAACEIQTALESNELDKARQLVNWHLVSRDTTTLETAQVAAATIESVAENTSDSVVAPLFYYALGGLLLALVYRFVNTADAMLGYRDPAREWLGKFPALLDDILNYIPARITGMLFILVAHLTDRSGSKAWRTMRQDAQQTDSPNAGYPMSAMAGGLGVELAKAGQYNLGAGGYLPQPNDINNARKLMRLVTVVVAVAFIFLSLSRRIYSTRKSVERRQLLALNRKAG
jgi:adenosylcobinamide-phosphate synthase